MRYLYIDKFRGFKRTVIALKDVNFLIGENSTGKTSILALLDLFRNPQFYWGDTFNTPHHEFGGFKDIISIAESDAKEFAVGMLNVPTTRKKRKVSIRGFVLEYRNSRGHPYCSFWAAFENSNVISVKLQQDVIEYSASNLPSIDTHKNPGAIFSYLRKTKRLDGKVYRKLPKAITIESKTERQGLATAMLSPFIEFIAAQTKWKKTKDRFTMLPLGVMPDMVWLAPIRTKPKRTYDSYDRSFSPEGEHTPYVLRKTLTSIEKAKKFRDLLKRFGKNSGLFRTVEIRQLSKEATGAFEVLVVLERCQLRIDSVGYGISQVLPIVVEIIRRPKNHWFALQQTEIHLHPKAQAALGDLLFLMAREENKKFLIETHSDFTIDRFRMAMRKTRHDLSVQILFFERKHDFNEVTLIPIEQNGAYSADQPDSFREFFLKEQENLLGV